MKPGNRKRNKPRPTEPGRTIQTQRCRAPDAAARAQQHGSEQWSPLRDEGAAGSNYAIPTTFAQVTALQVPPRFQSSATRRNTRTVDPPDPWGRRTVRRRCA